MKHLLEHRQELHEQMDILTLEHDQLQQHLTRETTDQPSPLMARINRWESKSIEKIQRVADEVRSQLRDLLAQTKKDIERPLQQIAAELRENRRAESFTETELKKWTNQLRELKAQLEKPSTIRLMNDEGGISNNHIAFIRLQGVTTLEQIKGINVEYRHFFLQIEFVSVIQMDIRMT